MTSKKNVVIHGETYLLVRDFKDDPELRAGFNALTQAVFQFDFEQWYQAGYWKQAYSPFSLMKDGRFVANVSVNDLMFLIDGKEKKAIQIGTVMTDPAFRNRRLRCESWISMILRIWPSCSGSEKQRRPMPALP